MIQASFLHHRLSLLNHAKKPFVFFILAAISIPVMAAFARALPPRTLAVSPSKISGSYEAIIGVFSVKGFSPRIVHSISKPYFSVPGEVIAMGGDTIQAFAYADAAAAAHEASGISEDGAVVAGRKIPWRAAAHFFRKDNVIVFYLGSNADFLRLLQESMGSQIAGARIFSMDKEMTLN